MQNRIRGALLASAAMVAIAWNASLASAAEPENTSPVDPASVTVPDLTFKPTSRDARNYDEYFFFYLSGVSTAKALADIEECRAYSLALNPLSAIPAFVPIGGDTEKPDNSAAYANAFAMWGPVGVGVFAWAMDDVVTDLERANTRRCMNYKGYKRYGTSRAIWREIRKGGDGEMKARLARIASAIQPPPGETIEP